MPSLTPMTELEAVNTILEVIGESPISALEVAGLGEAAIARNLLHKTSRAVQMVGWHFNAETDYTLSLTADKEIPVPANTLKVDTTREYADYDVTQRGSRLYNKGTKSFTFDKPLKVDIVFFLPFEDLPEAARYYITVRAARIFQDRFLGDDGIHTYTTQDEESALADLKDAEGGSGDYNFFTDSLSVSQGWLR